MKIGLYSPYWDTLGGGEKYLFDIASCFPNDQIIFLSKDINILEKTKERFNFSRSDIKIISDFQRNGKLDYDLIKPLDLFFYQCDGSLFFGRAKKNVLLIQSPVHSPSGIKNILKVRTWQKVVCNSRFTANFVKAKLKINPDILNPAVENFKPLKKTNTILSVGRFFPHLHSKKQEVLIEIFKQFCHSPFFGHPRAGGDPGSYRLVLVGSVSTSDLSYLNNLKQSAQGYPIEFAVNINHQQLAELYGKAKIFWHAAGYGEDLEKHPENAEHFGISTVEAISAGCYPLVFKAGGQTEILGDNPEFYWETKGELLEKTRELINNEKLIINNLKIIKDIPQKYSFENFRKKLYEIVS